MSYAIQLHHVTPDQEMIFPLLCYCFGKQWSQVARWAIDFLGFAFGISPYGMRLRAEGMRRAGTGGQGHGGQQGAKEGQRTRGAGGGIDGAMQQGWQARTTDAPQGPQRPRKLPSTHHTRVHPYPSLANIALS